MRTSFERKTDDFLDYLSLVPRKINEPLEHLWDIEQGEMKILGIINNDKITVSQVIFRDGPSTDWHQHPESEYLLLYEGSPIVVELIENEQSFEKTITFNSVCLIKANQKHRIKRSKGNSKLIVITIPGSKNFPEGKINVS